jgi:hypothetical protein
MAYHYFKSLLIACLLLLITACGNDYAKQIEKNYSTVQLNLDELERKLYYKQLTNAKIVAIYADKLTTLKPDFKSVADAMAKDATEKGILYLDLKRRLNKVNKKPENKQQFQRATESLMSIDMGANPIVFNDALLDLINTMAELSDGQLDTVSIPKDSQAAHARGEIITPGSYLVGNPNYGEYRQNSGNSFWHWYGQYSFFNSLLGGGYYNRSPIGYNSWNTRSHYSYYQDYGRNTYGSSSDRVQTARYNSKMRKSGINPVTKPKKQYGSVNGRKRVSTYSRQRANQTNYFNSKQDAGGRHSGKVASKRSSSFFASKPSSSSSSKRSSSFFGSSSRSSSSRSSFSGK